MRWDRLSSRRNRGEYCVLSSSDEATVRMMPDGVVDFVGDAATSRPARRAFPLDQRIRVSRRLRNAASEIPWPCASSVRRRLRSPRSKRDGDDLFASRLSESRSGILFTQPCRQIARRIQNIPFVESEPLADASTSCRSLGITEAPLARIRSVVVRADRVGGLGHRKCPAFLVAVHKEMRSCLSLTSITPARCRITC